MSDNNDDINHQKTPNKQIKTQDVTPHTTVEPIERTDGFKTTKHINGKRTIKSWPVGTKPLFRTAM
jgi:hypothetical protein